MFLALAAHGVEWIQGVRFFLYDPLKNEIPGDNIAEFIQQYKQSFGFYVEVELITANVRKTQIGVTGHFFFYFIVLYCVALFQEFERYLNLHGCTEIIAEEKFNSMIKSSSRKLLIKVVCSFIESQFAKATKPEIEDVCLLLLQLFPSLKLANSQIGGIVGCSCLKK